MAWIAGTAPSPSQQLRMPRYGGGGRWLFSGTGSPSKIYCTSDFLTYSESVRPTTVSGQIVPLDACSDGNRWYVVGDNGMAWSTDGMTGAAWEASPLSGTVVSSGGVWFTKRIGCNQATGTLVIIGHLGHISVSNDAGATWTPKIDILNDSSANMEMWSVAHSGTHWMVSANAASIYISADDGDTWTAYSTAVRAGPSGPISSSRFLTWRSDVQNILISEDAGVTWPAVGDAAVATPEVGSSGSGLYLYERSTPKKIWKYPEAGGERTAVDMTGAPTTITTPSGSTLGRFGVGDRLVLTTYVLGDPPYYSLIGPSELSNWTTSLNPLLLQDFYTLTISAPGFTDIEVPISSWQATANEGDLASYVQAVVPAVTDWIDLISERQAGELIITMGYILPDGTSQSEEVIRSAFTDFRIDTGPTRSTGTLSGTANLALSEPDFQTTLRGVRSISVQGGLRRATCSIDMFLKPGMTVTAEGEEFVVSYINYFANATERFMQVGER